MNFLNTMHYAGAKYSRIIILTRMYFVIILKKSRYLKWFCTNQDYFQENIMVEIRCI